QALRAVRPAHASRMPECGMKLNKKIVSLACQAKPWPSPVQSTGRRPFIPMPDTGYFHLHLVSDATGETLIMVARAAAAQYANVAPVEHLYPMVRSMKQLDPVLSEISEAPGLVLYTLLEEDLIQA